MSVTTPPAPAVSAAADPVSVPAAAVPGSTGRSALIEAIVTGLAAIAGHQRCAVARRLHRQGISMAHLQTLWILQEHGPQPMTHLADLLGVAVPNATGIIDRMEQRGLVERVREVADRRVVTVRQTEGGVRAAEEIDGWRNGVLQELLDRLETEHLLRLVGGINEFRDVISTDATGPGRAAPGPGHATGGIPES